MKNFIFTSVLCVCLTQAFFAQLSADIENVTQASSTPQRSQEKNLAKGQQTKTGESEEKNVNQKEKNKEQARSPHKLTSAVTFLSDYRSRGISQTLRRPGVQGELKYTHESGFYFKNWGSNVDGSGNLLNNTSLEWDIFLGFKHLFLETQIEYDVGFLYYYYPGGRAFVPANTRYDTLEYYLSFEYNKLEFKVSLTLTDYFADNSSNPPMNWNKKRPIRPNGHSYGSSYWELNYELPFWAKWKANFHLGYQKIVHYPQLNYIDWLIGLAYEFEWFEITATYVQTTAKQAFYKIPDHSFHPQRIDLGGPGLIIGIDKNF